MRHCLLALTVILLCLSALLPYGCGEGSPEIDQRVLEVLSAAKDGMDAAGSCRIFSTIAVADDIKYGDIRLRDTSLILETEWTEDSLRACIISGGADYKGDVIGYVFDGKEYYRNEEGVWYYSEYDPLAASLNGSGSSIPAGFDDMGALLDRADVLWEDERAIACHIEFGKDYFQTLLTALKKNIGSDADDKEQEIINMYELIMDKIKIESIITIDKQSNLPMSENLNMRFDEIPVPERGNISFTVEERLNYKDYGSDFDIVLPERVQKAPREPQ